MQIILFLLCAAVIILLALVIRLSRQQKLISEQNRQLQSSLEEAQLPHADTGMQEIRLRVLQNQINPHFLYNTLESIRSLAICGNPEDLPQIAAMADEQFLVRKFDTDGVTHTEVSKLTREQRIIELARMVGGADFTSESSIHHAGQMLSDAERRKAELRARVDGIAPGKIKTEG